MVNTTNGKTSKRGKKTLTREKLLTVKEAAAIKNVSEAALRRAIDEERLPAQWLLGRWAITESDLIKYEPQTYNGRPGAKGNGGRPKGSQQSEETKARIALAQKEAWAKRKEEQKNQRDANSLFGSPVPATT